MIAANATVYFLYAFLAFLSFLLINYLWDLSNNKFDVIKNPRMLNRNCILEVMMSKTDQSDTLLDSTVLRNWA